MRHRAIKSINNIGLAQWGGFRCGVIFHYEIASFQVLIVEYYAKSLIFLSAFRVVENYASQRPLFNFVIAVHLIVLKEDNGSFCIAMGLICIFVLFVKEIPYLCINITLITMLMHK